MAQLPWFGACRREKHAAQLSGLRLVPCLALGWGAGVQGPRFLHQWVGWVDLCPALHPSTPAPEREKRENQAIIDSLRDTLEERNATVESLQKALDKAEMLCSTLKVGPGPCGHKRVGSPGPGLASGSALVGTWVCTRVHGRRVPSCRGPPYRAPLNHKARAILAALRSLVLGNLRTWGLCSATGAAQQGPW